MTDRQPQPGSLKEWQVVSKWQTIPLDQFSFANMVAAAARVLPEATGADETTFPLLCIHQGVKFKGCAWPDSLRAIATWTAEQPFPPVSALQAAYAAAIAELPGGMKSEGIA